MTTLAYIIKGLYYFLRIISWAIVIDALLSWFMSPSNPIKSFLDRFVEPFIAPFRRLMSNFNTRLPVDFSPLLAIIALNIISQLVVKLGLLLGWII